MAHKVYRVHMMLQNEDGGPILATKCGRIHATDFEAGVYHCEIKLKEILIDAKQVIDGA